MSEVGSRLAKLLGTVTLDQSKAWSAALLSSVGRLQRASNMGTDNETARICSTWKQRPRRFVEPPLVTHIECLGFSQNCAKERKVAKTESDATAERS
eukprot:Skav225225  [mRNA]  locus=scaffold2946:10220:11370:+ [translate_table: standard]